MSITSRRSGEPPADDVAAGVYFPVPITTFKIKKKDGSKIFVNLCSHSALDRDEEILSKHSVIEVRDAT